MFANCPTATTLKTCQTLFERKPRTTAARRLAAVGGNDEARAQLLDASVGEQTVRTISRPIYFPSEARGAPT